MHEFLSQIAIEENGSFSQKDSKYATYMGNGVQQLDYEIRINYRGKEIWILNILGGIPRGEMELLLPVQSDQMDFEIITKSRFSTFFSKKKDRIKISCKNHDLLRFLIGSSELQKLHDIIKNTAFKPYFKGKYSEKGFLIRTEYQLAFEERRDIIRPLIAFYKVLMDKFV